MNEEQTTCSYCRPVKRWKESPPYVEIELCKRHANVDALITALARIKEGRCRNERHVLKDNCNAATIAANALASVEAADKEGK